MATITKPRLTKTRRVINHLRSGKTLTAAQAQSKFGVQNLRAMISSIREDFEAFGNWIFVTNTNSKGNTVYSMLDNHPGQRVYGFDEFGNRFRL